MDHNPVLNLETMYGDVEMQRSTPPSTNWTSAMTVYTGDEQATSQREFPQLTPSRLQVQPVQTVALSTVPKTLNLRMTTQTLVELKQKVQDWMQTVANHMLQQHEYQLDLRYSLENQELLQVVQIQTQFIQELKKYVDDKDMMQLETLSSLWDQVYTSMQVLSHSQDQQRHTVIGLANDLQAIHHCLDQLAQQHLPDFCANINGQFTSLSGELSGACKLLHNMCSQNQTGLMKLEKSHSTLEEELQSVRTCWKQQFDALHSLVLDQQPSTGDQTTVAPSDSHLLQVVRQQVEDLYKQMAVLNRIVVKARLQDTVAQLERRHADLVDKQEAEFARVCQELIRCDQEQINMQFQLDDVCKSMKNLELTMVPSMQKLSKQHGHAQHVEDKLTDKTYQLEQRVAQLEQYVHVLTTVSTGSRDPPGYVGGAPQFSVEQKVSQPGEQVCTQPMSCHASSSTTVPHVPMTGVNNPIFASTGSQQPSSSWQTACMSYPDSSDGYCEIVPEPRKHASSTVHNVMIGHLVGEQAATGYRNVADGSPPFVGSPSGVNPMHASPQHVPQSCQPLNNNPTGHHAPGEPRFNPGVHQMVSDDMRPEAWKGDWLDLEDLYVA